MKRSMKRSRGISNILQALESYEIGLNSKRALERIAEIKVATSACYNTRYEVRAKSTFLVAFSPDRSTVASSHGDHTIKIFSLKTGKLVTTLSGHSRTAWCLSYHPSLSSILASGSLAGEIRVWDLNTCDCQSFHITSGNVISSLSFPGDDDVLAAAASNKLYFLNWRTGAIITTFATGSSQESIRIVRFVLPLSLMVTGILNDPDEREQSLGDVGIQRNPAFGRNTVQTVSCHRIEDRNTITTTTPSTICSRSNAQYTREGLSSSESSGKSHLNLTSGEKRERNRHRYNCYRSRSRVRSGNARNIGSFDEDHAYNGESSEKRMDTRDGDSLQHSRSDRSSLWHDSGGSSSLQSNRGDGSSLRRSRGDGSSLLRNSGDDGTMRHSSVDGSTLRHGSSIESNAANYHSDSGLGMAQTTGTSTHSTSDTNQVEDLVSSSDDNRKNPEASPRLHITPINTNSGQPRCSLSSNAELRSSNADDVGHVHRSNTVGHERICSRQRHRRGGIGSGRRSPRVWTSSNNSDRPYRSEIWNVDLGQGGAEVFASQVSIASASSQSMNNFSVGSRSAIPVYSFISYPSESRYTSSVSGMEPDAHAIATATARTPRHMHTAVVIAGSNESESDTALRTAINRAIAGAFAGNGEGAVAANIVNTTYRLQLWDLNDDVMVDLRQSKRNVVVPHCKLHNDGSIDVSQDGTLLATYVPSTQGFPDNGHICVFSLREENLGQCIYSRSYGPNLVCVSFSPLNNYILVGLASRAVLVSTGSEELMGQILKLPEEGDDIKLDDIDQVVLNVVHPKRGHLGLSVSVNTAKFHPSPGVGIIYGTNNGAVRHCRVGKKAARKRNSFISEM